MLTFSYRTHYLLSLARRNGRNKHTNGQKCSKCSKRSDISTVRTHIIAMATGGQQGKGVKEGGTEAATEEEQAVLPFWMVPMSSNILTKSNNKVARSEGRVLLQVVIPPPPPPPQAIRSP